MQVVFFPRRLAVEGYVRHLYVAELFEMVSKQRKSLGTFP